MDKNKLTDEQTSMDFCKQSGFVKLISKLSAEFINIPFDNIDEKIDECLKIMVHSLGIDRSLLHEFSEDKKKLHLSHFYVRPGIKKPTSIITSGDQPYLTKKMLSGETICINQLDDLPPAAKLEKKYLTQQGVKSALAIPLIVGQKSIGALTFTTVKRERPWPDEEVNRLKLIGEIFANAINRKYKESKLHETLAEIESQLQFEALIAKLSTEFINLSFDQIDTKIEKGLKLISDTLDIDRIALLQFSRDRKKLHLSHRYAADHQNQPPLFLVSEQLPWFSGSLKSGKTLRISNVHEIPKKAAPERQYIRKQGIKSFLTIPLKVAGSTIGAISYSSIHAERTWPDKIVLRLKLTSEVFGNALGRKRKEQELYKALTEIRELKDQLQRENLYLKEEIQLEHKHEEIVGKNASIRKIIAQVEQVALTDSTVLISGETGTGKELVANEIHKMSLRKDRPLVKINCAALPAALVENELFGREKGAYTGALSRQVGRFEFADGATIFLDEIGELPIELQTKLLRVLDDGQFERLGSTKTISVDVRIIAATNMDLEKAVQDRRFREDLYYRLNVYPIEVPPLRERLEDIPELLWAFVRVYSEKMGKKIERVSERRLDALKNYRWPGNVRELRNLVERAMILSNGKSLQLEPLKQRTKKTERVATLNAAQRKHIISALEMTGWRVSGHNGAADLLDINPKTLESRMRKLGITRKSTES